MEIKEYLEQVTFDYKRGLLSEEDFNKVNNTLGGLARGLLQK